MDTQRPANQQGLLKKHTSQPRTYNLNKQDAKMVKDAVTKKQ